MNKQFNYMEDEVIDTPETEIVEENFYLEDSQIKNKNLVRMDMNLVQYPIFSKNTKRKINQIVKYYFNKNRDTYITVTPAAGNYIPGEAEEKLFIALMKIMKKKGMPRQFVVTLSELKEELKVNTNRYAAAIKESLIRLSSTSYNFKNTMYSSEKKSLLSQEIQTAVMSVRIFDLREPKNKSIRKDVDDLRVKAVYEISISDQFYNNIMTKGYLVYDSDILLSINTSTARTIYMLIEKLRFNERYIKIDTLFLIKRIPLKFSKNHLSQTIKTLTSSLEELQEKKLIKNFTFIKETTWEKSEIEIFFNEKDAIQKQERFFCDLNDFRKLSTSLTISDTEHDTIIKNEITQERLDEIYALLPDSAKKLKSIPKTLKDSVEKYGYEKVMLATQYLKKQKNLKSPRAFFIKALENDWAQDEILPKEKENSKGSMESPKPAVKTSEETQLDQIKNFYLNLPKKEKIRIEEEARQDYFSKNHNKKIAEITFTHGKLLLISEYIKDNHDKAFPMLDDELDNRKEEKPSTYTKDMIDTQIQAYGDIFGLKKDEIFDLKFEVANILITKDIQETVTPEELKEIIKQALKKL